MTIICCRCHITLGEKCPTCGRHDGLETLAAGSYFCPDCRMAFPPGMGGDTHTYCGSCLAIVLRGRNRK